MRGKSKKRNTMRGRGPVRRHARGAAGPLNMARVDAEVTLPVLRGA